MSPLREALVGYETAAPNNWTFEGDQLVVLIGLFHDEVALKTFVQNSKWQNFDIAGKVKCFYERGGQKYFWFTRFLVLLNQLHDIDGASIVLKRLQDI